MTFRKAVIEDLPELCSVFKHITDNLNGRGIYIWNEVYPNCIFPEDIGEGRMYILENENGIVSAFALLDSDKDKDYVQWKKQNAKSCYLYRMGIIPEYYGKGIGAYMLEEAAKISREKGAEYLRLFVADCNPPAIRFYEKNGYKIAEGVFQKPGLNFLLLGYEIKL